MELVTGFITLVQLIALYKELKKSGEIDARMEFETFLKERKHKEVLDLINRTHHLQTEVTKLLQDDHEQILEKINELNKVSMSIAARLDSFKQIVQTVTPEDALPDERLPKQAMDIMTCLVSNGQNGFQFIQMLGGDRIATLPDGQSLPIQEPHFFEDDCELLVSLGYLRAKHTTQCQIWHLKRAGLEFGKSLIEM